MLTQTAAAGRRRMTGEAWSARPRLALGVRVVAFVGPIVASVAATSVVNRWLPQTTTLVGRVLLTAVLGLVATAVLFVADRGARKLLPLAALLKLSLVFPDHAPSRYRTALRTGTVHQLEKQVADIKAHGFADDETRAAEQLLELVAALSVHDRITRGHAERVRAYARLIGEELRLSEPDLERLHWSALLHDVGKLFVPAEILNKPGKLTHEEFEVIKQHPGWGAELCEPLRGWLGDWVDAVGQHHEWWDGHGYPNGLAGEDIALAARIVSVADVFDVITSARSYKRAEGVVEAREELARCAGTQFEPRMVRAFLTVSLGRLRLLMGPLSSLAHLPGVGRLPLGGISAATSGLVTAGALLVGGVLDTSEAEAPSTPAPMDAPAPDRPEPVTEPVTEPPPVAPASTPPAPPMWTPVGTPAEPPPEPEPAAAPLPPIAPPPPAAPVPADDLASTNEDAAVLVDVLANDANADRVAWVDPPSTGTATIVDGKIRFVPAADSAGTASFTYFAEGAGGTAAATAAVTVLPVNDAPAFRAGADVVVPEDAGPQVVAGWATDVAPGPADESSQAVTFSTVTTDPSLFATSPAVGPDGTLTFTPAPNASGSSTVAVTAHDTGGTARGGIDASAAHVLTITVTPVNDAPAFAAGADVTVAEDSGAASIPWATAITTGPADESGQGLSFTATAADPSLFALLPALAPDGTLTFTPAPNAWGTTTVDVVLADDGGTADGGDDTSATHVLTITVTSEPDPPVAGDDAYTTPELTPLVVPAPGALANDGDEDGDSLTATLAVSPTSGGAVTMLPDGSLVYTPVLGFTGEDTFTYTVSDGTSSDTGTVTVLVSSASTATTFYLANSGPGPEDWALLSSAPSGASPDPDGDGTPGLTIKHGDQKLTGTDVEDLQHWRYTTPTDLVLAGPVTLGLWSTAQDFDPNDDLDYSIWLQDCAADGTGCTTIASTGSVHVDEWNGGVAGWVHRDITLGNVNHTVTSGRMLQLRVMVGHHDLWVATDPSMPSTLTITQPA